MFGKRFKYPFFYKAGVILLAVKTCFLLAIILLVTSCCPPIWSKMKKRAEADIAAKAFIADQTILVSDNFQNIARNWVVEAEDRYSVLYQNTDSCLDMSASKGLTLWCKKPFEGNFRIRYEACVVDQGDSLDRVSDLGCFWLASDPLYPDSIFTRTDFRKKAMGRYYSLQLYSMNVGGNSNSVTRFRRYDGRYENFHHDMKRPEILKEYTDQAHLITPNHWYTIEITVRQGRIQYIQDGVVMVDYVDFSPLKKGWFGIRTMNNHLRVRKFVATTF